MTEAETVSSVVIEERLLAHVLVAARHDDMGLVGQEFRRSPDQRLRPAATESIDVALPEATADAPGRGASIMARTMGCSPGDLTIFPAPRHCVTDDEVQLAA